MDLIIATNSESIEGRMRSNRSRVEITADILELACSSCKPTTIMYRANLSYDQLRTYLAYLSGKGWIIKEGGEWRATEKGREYLAIFFKLKEFLDDEGVRMAEPALVRNGGQGERKEGGVMRVMGAQQC